MAETPRDEDLFFFDRAPLDRCASERQAAYASAHPFPHAVLDDLVPPSLARAVAAEFPPPTAPVWSIYRSGAERRLALRDETLMGPQTRHLFAELRGTAFLRFLERLTGIENLIASPHHGAGGGLYHSEPGCFLNVHADFNVEPYLGLDRRLNLIVYLNENWRDEWGGDLELWDKNVTRCEARITPRFNRTVVFNTTDIGFHGHPEPLRCPDGETRKSLAIYYFTNGRPEHETAPPHGTIFRPRPQDGAPPRASVLLRRYLPPIVFDVARRLVPRR